MSVAYGTNLLQRSLRASSDPTRGKRATAVWEGTRDATTVMSLILDKRLSWETDDSSNNGMVSLSISSPDNLALLTTWGLRGNQLNKHVYEHWRTIANVSTDDLKKIKAFLEGPQDAADPTGLGTDAAKLLFLMKHQETHFILARYVLHMRSVGSIENCFNAAVLNPNSVGLIFTKEQIMPGGTFDMHIHPSVAAYMGAITAETEPANFKWGYLFQTPSIDPVPGGNHELRQEWWLGLWSTYLYGEAA